MDRRGARFVAWLGLLLACAGAAAQDEYPFKLETSREGGASVIRARNQGAIPVSLRLVLPVAENVAAEPRFPIYMVIPARTNLTVARITQADRTKAWRYQYQSRRSFGSFEARHDPAAMYRVPWIDGRTFIIGQAPGGKITTHLQPYSKEAIDVTMPEGTPVVAARGGVVFTAISEHDNKGALDESMRNKANVVRILPVVSRYHQQAFKGVNDLTFAENGDLYFTDQGVSDMADPSGGVYRYTAAGKLEQLANCLPSPNGLVVDGRTVYVAVTRGNAVWRLPMTPEGKVVRLGVFLHLSGGRGPDGMAMDEKGGLAVAHVDFGAVWIYSHRGEALYRVNSCKSDMVTNVAYNGNEVYITDSGSGCILRASVPTPGRTLFSHL